MAVVNNYCDNHGELRANIENAKETMCKFDADNQKDHDEIWEAINGLRNRLPLWATFLITGMGSVIGYLLALISKN